MKKMAFSLIVLLASIASTQAQEKKVPTSVVNAFKKAHPNTKVSWDIEEDGYEAEFKMNGKNASENYSLNGEKMATEIEIEATELPKKAVQYIEKNHSGKKIKETAKITDAKGVVTFEIELKIDGKNTDLLFDINGNFLK
jgi:phage gp46-like protein